LFGGKYFLAAVSRQKTTIVLNAQKRDEIEINRKRLCLIVETVLLCGWQGLAICGAEDSGNLTFAEM